MLVVRARLSYNIFMSKVGRPQVGDRKRDKQLVVMVSQDEYRELKEWSVQQPYSLSSIARALLIREMSKRDQQA